MSYELKNKDGYWGEPIEVNGVRPDWLKGHVTIALKTSIGWTHQTRKISRFPAEEFSWKHTDGATCITHVAFKAEAPIYKAQAMQPFEISGGIIQGKVILPETIVAAACQFGGITLSMPQPARHHTILHAYHDALDPDTRNPIRGSDQGFLTSTGRYVDREEGLEIAKKNNQIIKKHGNDRILFSEDMW